MIRLARFGKNKKPTYRFIVSEKGRDTKGTYLESLGWYNPRTNPATVDIDAERAKYWLGKGAQASGTVNNILVDQNIIKTGKVKIVKTKKKPADGKAAAPAEKK